MHLSSRNKIFRLFCCFALAVPLVCSIKWKNPAKKGLKDNLRLIQFRSRAKEIKLMKDEDVKKYEAKKKNAPKLDYDFQGTILQPESAGRANTGTIIGGTVARSQQFPWMVLLTIDEFWLCGGSLISLNCVLTAAHCVHNISSVIIRLGGATSTSTWNTKLVVVSKRVSVHPNYNDALIQNDIAIVHLPSDVQLNNIVNVVRLPALSDGNTTFVKTMATVSGYGMVNNTGAPSNTLNFVELAVIRNSRCAKYFGEKSVTSSNICTAKYENKGTCGGDSGSPLVYKDKDRRWTQIGVVSFGSVQTCTKYPSGYARVTSFCGWISKTANLKLRP